MLTRERVLFPKNKQKEFMKEIKKLSNKQWVELAELLETPYNTIQTYYKETNRLPFKKFTLICKTFRLKKKEILQKYDAKKINWAPQDALSDVTYIGKERMLLNGGKMAYKAKSLEIDAGKISFSESDLRKGIVLPEKITPELAEETGTSLGDGFISANRFEYRLKGNKKDEKEYYKNFVKPLFKKLYNAEVAIKEFETTVGFELSSKAIWSFKTKTLGIKRGRKTEIGVPDKFKVADKKILSSLIRGYFDTDGNIYFKSQGKNKRYYPVISAASASNRLMNDIFEILGILGFEAKLYERENINEIKLNGYKNFELYNKIIGTNQPKNIKKINEWSAQYPKIAEKFMAAAVYRFALEPVEL